MVVVCPMMKFLLATCVLLQVCWALPLTYRPHSNNDVTKPEDGFIDDDIGVFSTYTGVLKGITCDACKVIVYLAQHLLQLGKSRDEIAKIVTTVCISLKIADKKVCTGLIGLYKDEVLTVIDKLALSPSEVCGYVIGDQCGSPYDPFFMWNVTFPDTPKPPIHKPVLPPSQAPKLRVLQLSDIHIDLRYAPGTNTDCHEPICCRNDSGAVVGAPSGKWGDYRNCDTPPWTLENLFEHLSKSDRFDYILWTGDMPGHNIWNQTRHAQVNLLGYLTKLFVKYFPKTPVYSTLGNHESAPVNRSGCYTVLIRPGFRIISLNTNYCVRFNWWLLLNMTDPAGQLQWLITTLQEAENQKEKVHIIGHVPPGKVECLKAWSWNYYNIINRYESTVTAQFFGHTHFDELEIFYDETNWKRPISVAYIAPSVTPFRNMNPGYRIYQIDGDHQKTTRLVLDYETHIFNLSEANRSGHPVWLKEYSAKKEYNMTSLLPEEWDKLVHRMAADDSLLQRYYRFYYKMHPPSPKCDASCRQEMLCDIISGRSHDPDICKKSFLTI